LVPEFEFRANSFYEQEHRIKKVQVDVDGEFKYKGIIQAGPTESNILCHKCDNEILSGLEKYASNINFSKDKIVCQTFENKKGTGYELWKTTKYSGIDYARYKLYLLSLLFRASISNLDGYTRIKLNTNEEKELAEMILKNNPCNEDTYPIRILSFRETPMETRWCNHCKLIHSFEGYRTANLILGGLIYVFYLPEPKSFYLNTSKSGIHEDNTVDIVSIPTEELQSIIAKIIKA